jgi:Phage gp6-like head-tail connector protein
MASWPTLKEVRTLLRLQPDPVEDGVIQTSLAAAIDFGVRRMGDDLYPPDTDQLPDSAHQACLLHAARLYRRRDSLDGTLGWGEMGVVRVGRVDPDVASLYDTVGPWGFA